MSAIVQMGWDETTYFEKPRTTRALLVAQFAASRALTTMRDYDTRPKPADRTGKKAKKPR